MAGIFVIFVLGIGLAVGQHNGNHGGGSVPDPGQVDAAIVNIELHYNDKLCLELLLVDCTKHVTVGDEQVCASNGVTYANHCRFTHAMCEFLHGQNHISLINHGPCVVTTTNVPAGSTVAPAGSTMAQVASTSAPVAGSTFAPMVTSPPAVVVTTDAPTTTTPMSATTNPINSILQNVFCQNAGSISCASGFKIICGTDGQLYPNECELSKAKCNNPSLTIADNSKCALP